MDKYLDAAKQLMEFTSKRTLEEWQKADNETQNIWLEVSMPDFDGDVKLVANYLRMELDQK